MARKSPLSKAKHRERQEGWVMVVMGFWGEIFSSSREISRTCWRSFLLQRNVKADLLGKKRRFFRGSGSNSIAVKDDLKRELIRWEQLRVIYNVVVGSFGWWLSWGICDEMGGLSSYLFGAILYGVAANMGFSLGPLLSVYLRAFSRFSGERLILPLFVVGTLFSLLVTAVVYWSIWGLPLPKQS